MRAVPADVPAGDREEAEQSRTDEPEHVRVRADHRVGSHDECRDERSGLGVPDDADGERALVLASVAQDGGADDPRQHRGRDCRGETRERRPEGEAPGQQDDGGESGARPALPHRERTCRQSHRMGCCYDVRCAWGDCHVRDPVLVG